MRSAPRRITPLLAMALLCWLWATTSLAGDAAPVPPGATPPGAPPDTALDRLVVQAEALHRKGQPREALRLSREALDLAASLLPPDSPRLPDLHAVLAYRLRVLGRHAEARLQFETALRLRRELHGPRHPLAARDLVNLADVLRVQGEYDKALPLLDESLAIREEVLGPHHGDVAHSLRNKGHLLTAMGDHDAARALFARAVAIQEEDPATPPLELAKTLNYQGEGLRAMGELAEARQVHERCLAIRLERLGPRHQDVATTLNNLAGLHRSLKNRPEAARLYREALSIREEVLGPAHPQVSSTLSGLARLAEADGDLAQARSLLERAVAIREAAFGPEHPKTAQLLHALGLLLVSLDEPARGYDLMRRAQRGLGRQAELVMGFASEHQKHEFLRTLQLSLGRFLSLAARFSEANGTGAATESPPADSSWRRAAPRQSLDIWLARKGILLESERRLQDALMAAADPQVRDRFEELNDVRRDLLQRLLEGAGDEDEAAEQAEMLDALEARRQVLREQLSRDSQAFARDQARVAADADAVARALPPGTALLDFALVDAWDPVARKPLGPRYLAFVLPAGKGDEAALLDLAPAELVDERIRQARRAIQAGDPAADVPLASLRDLLWTPLAPLLRDVETVIVSPDGDVNLLPLEILPLPGGGRLIEERLFHYLAAGRELAGASLAPAPAQGPPLLLGDPDYGVAAPVAIPDADAATPSLPAAILDRRAPDLRSLRFDPLPGARREVEEIAAILSARHGEVEVFLGSATREDALIRREPPRLLHLATHGFFLKDAATLPGQPGESGSKASSASGRKGGRGEAVPVSPLLRSGVALAGANRALAPGGGGEGLLVAEKVLDLTLRGTDLVVLSACSTGVGETRAGQGVQGLRRAFGQAGARSLIMSLWDVPDEETRELMTAFHESMAALPRHQALRQAVLRQRELVRRRMGADSILHWGAFIHQGDLPAASSAAP